MDWLKFSWGAHPALFFWVSKHEYPWERLRKFHEAQKRTEQRLLDCVYIDTNNSNTNMATPRLKILSKTDFQASQNAAIQRAFEWWRLAHLFKLSQRQEPNLRNLCSFRGFTETWQPLPMNEWVWRICAPGGDLFRGGRGHPPGIFSAPYKPDIGGRNTPKKLQPIFINWKPFKEPKFQPLRRASLTLWAL